MKTFTAAATVAALVSSVFAAPQAAGGLQINTPAAVVECQPAAITFSGGEGPYFISVIPGGQVSAAPLEQFPQQDSAGTFTWTVDIAAGTQISLQIRDGSGNPAYSSPVTIQEGTNSDCVKNGGAGGGSASGSASGGSPSASGSAGGSSAGGASSGGSSGGAAPTSAGGASSGGASSDGAPSASGSDNAPAPSGAEGGDSAASGLSVGMTGVALAAAGAILSAAF